MSADESHARPTGQHQLGRMAVFLLPSLKLKQRDASGRTVEERLHRFLMDHFAGYTAAAGNIFGFWRDEHGQESYGEHREFRVAFAEEAHLPRLTRFLSEMAAEMGEESIYLEWGAVAWLVSPPGDGEGGAAPAAPTRAG